MTFNDFGLSTEIIESIDFMGFDKPTPIQEQAIPIILNKQDLVGCAQTGTGKTAAFLLPLMEKIAQSDQQGIQALILVPTRELAQQIDENFTALSYFTNISAIAVYGGNQGDLFVQQKQAIVQGVDVVIATPGRLLAHHKLGYLDLGQLETLILDEADRMLDMGFIGDIMKIVELLPEKRQTLMFSATMKKDIRKLANEVLINPEEINLAVSKPAEGVNQQAYLVEDHNKIELLEYIIRFASISNMIIFASTKSSVDDIHRRLKKIGVACEAIHSDKEQQQRNELMRLFKAKKIKVLVATDILARGIDIVGLSHVINFNVPDDAEDYVHRVGRTARADKKGVAVTFINNGKDQLKFYNIEKLIEKELDKLQVPSEIGTSPEYNPQKPFKSNGKRKSFRRDKKSGRHKKRRD